MPGNEGVIGTAGFFGTSARDVELGIKTIIGTSDDGIWQKDSTTLKIPWDFEAKDRLKGEVEAGKKLRIAWLENDGNVLPHPNVMRAMKIWKEKLEKSDKVEIVEIDLEKLGDFSREGWELIREL